MKRMREERRGGDVEEWASQRLYANNTSEENAFEISLLLKAPNWPLRGLLYHDLQYLIYSFHKKSANSGGSIVPRATTTWATNKAFMFVCFLTDAT